MPDAQYMEKQQREVDNNYAAMEEMFSELVDNGHRGRYALMKDGKVVEVFDTSRDAVTVGNMLFSDRVFSAQKITDEAVLCPSVWLI